MTSQLFQTARIITGPTCSGKTELAVRVANRLGAEIVSMDSMTLYRGMDIGTAKPDAELRGQVRHHLIDVLDPWESASVAWWLRAAEAACVDIQARGRRVLIVGGTPLYLKALLFGLFDGPPRDRDLRQRLEAEAAAGGPAPLHARLREWDPAAGARIHPNDLRRIIRALEVRELTQKPISAWQRQWGTDATAQSGARPAAVWLDVPRGELYQRIDQRVQRMVRVGLVEEARRLAGLPQELSKEASQAIGYREAFEHIHGRLPLPEMVSRIQTRTRQLAKRQITWFRHLPGVIPSTQLTSDTSDLTMDWT